MYLKGPVDSRVSMMVSVLQVARQSTVCADFFFFRSLSSKLTDTQEDKVVYGF